MSAVQALNVLLPLFTFPYLIRVLGIELFGSFNYALAVVSFLVVVVDYGMTLTGTRDVAMQRHDQAALSRLFSLKWLLQCCLMLVALLLLLLIYVLLPPGKVVLAHLLLAFLLVPANVLLPTWFLQGMQAFKPLAWFSFLNKLLYVSLVFLFVKSPSDVGMLLVFYSGSQLFTSLIGLGWVVRKYGLRLQWPGIKSLGWSLKTGWPVFLSGFSVSVYTNSALLVLGYFGSDHSVGVFAIVEKVLLVFRLGLSTLFSVIFPKVSRLAAHNAAELRFFLRKIAKLMLLGLLPALLALYLLAPWLVRLLTGSGNAEVVHLLWMLLPIPLFLAFNMPSYQMLLASHQQKWYARVMVLAAVLGLGLNLLLAPHWHEIGTGMSLLVAELVIALGLIWGTEKRFPELRIWLTKNPI
jgi:PST family polysaccharide transporter